MAIYPSSVPVFDFFEDEGVFVCELTEGMIRELHGVLEDATVMSHEKGRWVPSPCIALKKQLENAIRQLARGESPPPRS